MRGVSAVDSRARQSPSRRPSSRFSIHEDATQEFRAEAPKQTTSIRPPSALMSTGHLLIHDELAPTDSNGARDASPRATAPRTSTSRLSGRFPVLDTGMAMMTDELSIMTSKMSNPSPLSRQFSARLQPQDIETTINSMLESPTRNASRHSSATLVSGRLQVVHGDPTSTNTLETPPVSPRRSRPSSPCQEMNDNVRVRSDLSANKPELPPRSIPHSSDIKPEQPIRKIPLSPIRQLSQRIKLHDDGALAANRPIMPIRQPSERLQIHRDGAVTVKRNSAGIKTIEAVSIDPGGINTRDSNDQGAAYQHHETTRSESIHEHSSDVPPSSATEPALPSSISRFVPLHSQWTYGQRVFGRYKKTPYFYSGNLATYLGGGMFMVVFDDGTLDYRVRREDIMLREHPGTTSPSNHQTRKRRGSQDQDNSLKRRESESTSISGLGEENVNSTNSRRKSRERQDEESEDCCPDPSEAPEMHLSPLQHVMVDFSVTPPREMVLSFDDSGTAYEVGLPSCSVTSTVNETWRLLLEDEALTMKRLECGVAYEDDSTQVSDSDESSDEDMTMTPWQQMTQTFGMGKAARPQRRRSSVSTVSQVDRLSITHKGRKQIISTPRSLKQIITDYFLRGNKKVQPAKLTDELVLAEHVRLMEANLQTMRSTRCSSGSPTASLIARGDCRLRVVYERAPDGIRTYGTVTERVEDGSYAVVTEDEDGISAQVVAHDKVDFLPSVDELEQQLTDLERSQRVLFAGQKVQVSLYPGSRFSGHGLITLEREYQSRFHILLANRIRLVNVPADMISPLREKKKAAVTITEDLFLVCSDKVKVYIGDQIYVKCSAGNGDLDTTSEEEKVGLLNGVYSNRTAAVDFADGSTGYEIPPHLIFKRKRLTVPADQDVRSLKNAVLMQASAAAHGGGKVSFPVLEEGYQVKADHPSKAAVESCIVIKTHASSACDLRFSDGTIAFEVFPSQMIMDSVEHQRRQTKATATLAPNENANRARQTPIYAVGDYVLAWSSRFGRYCSAKIIARTSQDPINAPEAMSSPSVSSISGVELTVQSTAMASTYMYTLVFDYGEQKAQMPLDKITRLDDTTALSHSQRLTNYSIDAMGFELSPVNFIVGEVVMGRVHGTARYFNGIVEAVNEKDRVCAVCFDSSERDTAVPFSAMFSVDSRPHLKGRSLSTRQVGSGGSSSSEAASRARFLSRHHVAEDTTAPSEAMTRRRRNSSGSVGKMLKSMAGSILRSSRSKRNLETRRGSHMVTEIGARFWLPDQ
ncbi:hypothetical protein PC110_g5219 [Phytophthora cactorum]|uniref:Uncharacterized protein n=2 Tax=Phytophthora cactorum TaxID=29920 RepID=A0A329SPU2_9STRA|nr:hypothetical protein PC114_g739 [Phytophthora cactorum]KAG2955880.1 hypothetical protein PC117_g5 [Phytophthora cactorum]KAG3207373.1 hypothetical protein PC128_g130 [Phytophthora cactorum]RAW38541.1 hypothetical protein PC110_g5219 [Phytophthora cactorum]